MKKIRCLKLEQKNNFDINKTLITGVNIYNNTIQSSKKIEPINVIKFTKKKDLNRVISNIIKSQINSVKDSIVIEKGSKGLFCNKFTKKGNVLKEKNNFKKIKKFMKYQL